jgi:hypothetical protein
MARSALDHRWSYTMDTRLYKIFAGGKFVLPEMSLFFFMYDKIGGEGRKTCLKVSEKEADF